MNNKEIKFKKSVLIINPTGGSPYHGPNLRSYNLAKNLNDLGYQTSIVANGYFHKFHSLPNLNGLITEEEIDGITYYWIRTKKYQGRGVGQIYNQFEFVYKLWSIIKKFDFPNFDHIICSSPPPFAVMAARKMANHYQASLIFEIRDLWPMVIQELGGFSSWHPYIKLLKLVERYAYRSSDHVVSVKPGDIDYISDEYEFNRDDFSYIPNGYDINNKAAENALEYLEHIPKDKFIVGYVGSLSVAYGIKQLIDAANALKFTKKLHFVIVGDGPNEEKLKELCIKYDLSNVTFLGRVNNTKIPAIVDVFDVCFLGYKKANWLKHGISSNKIYDYMAQKKPIVAAVQTNYNPIVESNCGISVEPENSEEIAKAIQSLMEYDPNDLKRLGENGYNYLKQNHTFRKIAESYIQLFKRLKRNK